jgi:hypothetical protein
VIPGIVLTGRGMEVILGGVKTTIPTEFVDHVLETLRSEYAVCARR